MQDNSKNIICSVWENQAGYNSMVMDQEAVKKLGEAYEAAKADGGGGRIFMFFRTKRDKKTSPHAFIKYITKAEVQAFEAKKQTSQEEGI